MLASAPNFVMWMNRHKKAPTEKTCVDFLKAMKLETPKGQKVGMVS